MFDFLHMKQINRATFYYASGLGFTGQSLASMLLANGLRQQGWQIKIINTPTFSRVTEQSQVQIIFTKVTLILRLLMAWLKGLWAAVAFDLLYVTLGQTRYALIRDGFPLLVRRVLALNGRAAIALHGNLFMNWGYHSVEAKLLRQIVWPARYVTILGPNQQQKLVDLGIPAQKVIQVDNTCLLLPISEQHCLHKQNFISQQPLNILYLSNLIESKGYSEFVEAISNLSSHANFAIDATLCGQIMAMDADSRFPTHEMARNWINEEITRINQSPLVRLRWISGADGKTKEKLFHEAHIFVLPTYYKVEAQPIAIIEALASGCAVITTKVGEIPTMVSQKTALLMDEVTPEAITKAIVELQSNPKKRLQLALNGLKLFEDRFAYNKHLHCWEKLLREIGN